MRCQCCGPYGARSGLVHRALAAFRAMARLRLLVNFEALAFPPFFPPFRPRLAASGLGAPVPGGVGFGAFPSAAWAVRKAISFASGRSLSVSRSRGMNES